MGTQQRDWDQEYGNGTGNEKMEMQDLQQDQEYENTAGNRDWEYGNGSQPENTGQLQGMRPGMGSRLGWEQDETRSGVTRERAGGNASNSGERGNLDRGHWEPGRGDMRTVPGQGVLDQLPRNLCQGLPEQLEPLGLGSPKA
ncbi:hypothetical protein DUI87_34318 [Hirundo rustica rustica]|uniref:Uncharacterized protein n=1 Tax=Hirundo rustica rustica TaxID=333673 RepID=A0A3M0IJZ9_HIRRU|nr:hypothetical protein DUI87_34318 [Hirundo rustica rustica]